MSKIERNWDRAIMNLNLLTQQGRLEWAVVPVTPARQSGGKIDFFYESDFKGKHLRVYLERLSVPFDDSYKHSEESVRVEFVDENGRSLWKFPESPAAWDLYETITFQTAGVDEALDELLTVDLDAKAR